MKQQVSDFVISRLRSWGVGRVFGYPGDGINGLLGAFERADGNPRFVQARHEEMAAFMACGHAKFTGDVGVCVATSGPGAIHMLNGLYDAKLDHQPVVAIVGQTARTALGSSYQQEVDLHALFKDVASAYVTTVGAPEAMRHALDRAFRTAIANRTVTCVIIPRDVQELPAVSEPKHKHDTALSSVGVTKPVIVPSHQDLQRASDILNAGERVAILVGAGARGCTSELMELADTLGAGIAKALLGKAVLDDSLPYVTGSIGLLGTEPTVKMMAHCDTLLMIGTGFPYTEFLPEPRQARAVQIDIDPMMLGLRYDTEVNLVGDSKATLQALLPRLAAKSDRHWRQRIETATQQWRSKLAARADLPAEAINPEKVFADLSPQLPDNVIVAGDSGSSTMWIALYLKLRPSMDFSLSGGLASMGSAMPYAFSAKCAYPDRPVIAIAGDGAMQMNGLNELITVTKYWREWSDPRFVVLVLNNRDLNMVTWEMRALAGNPKFPASQNIPDFPYADYARSLGWGGVRLEQSADIGAAFAAAWSADRPYLIETLTDGDVPMLPPHIQLDQARHFFEALRKGDVRRRGIIRQSIREIFAAQFTQTRRGDDAEQSSKKR